MANTKQPRKEQPSIATATVAELSAALNPLLAKGLPIREAQAGEVLPNLRSVYARAVIPSEPASRLHARLSGSQTDKCRNQRQAAHKLRTTACTTATRCRMPWCPS